MNLLNFEKFGKDQKRFMSRLLNGKWQVYGSELQHICECENIDIADMIVLSLETTANFLEITDNYRSLYD